MRVVFFCIVSWKKELHDNATWNDNANHRATHAPHVRNEPSYANLRTRNSVSVLIGSGRMHRWYCSQITRRADVEHENERAVIIADDNTLDTITLSKWYDPIGNRLIYCAFSNTSKLLAWFCMNNTSYYTQSHIQIMCMCVVCVCLYTF